MDLNEDEEMKGKYQYENVFQSGVFVYVFWDTSYSIMDLMAKCEKGVVL